MFPWGLHCKCPCTCCEPQPTSTSQRGSPVPLDWTLDLLWALWGPLRLWSGPILVRNYPRSPQLRELDRFHLWEHSLSTQIFHRCRVYLADHGDLICSLYSWWKDFWSSSLVTPSSFGFIPTSVCGPPTGVWSWGCLGALGSAPVRTRRRGGMTAWITGAPAVPNAPTHSYIPLFSCKGMGEVSQDQTDPRFLFSSPPNSLPQGPLSSNNFLFDSYIQYLLQHWLFICSI